MSKVGLHGKSFIPMLSSFACAIPGIMATRTIETAKDRLVTILVAPLMSCSARLPVYTVLIGACIPNLTVLGFLKLPGLTMLSMYLLGIVVALLMAWLFKKTLLKGPTPMLIMELPPYKQPVARVVVRHMWDRSKLFLRRAGTVILLVTVILWAMAHVPTQNGQPPAIENSLAGAIGRTIEPAIKPLGFNWKIGIGLLTSLAARETIIATLGAIYGMDPKTQKLGLETALARDLTPGGAFALLVFFAFAMQCISTIAVVRRETGGWKWPIFQFSYVSVVAYVGAFVAARLIY